MTTNYAQAKTCVFWDVEDCPILNGLDPKSIYENIKSALKNQGYCGEVSITAYIKKEPIESDFEFAGINLKIAGNQYGRFNSMFHDVLFSKRGLNLLIISRDKRKHTWYLRDREANSLYAEPKNLPEKCCNCGVGLDTDEPIIESQECKRKNALDEPPFTDKPVLGVEWVWTSLAFGGDPITKNEKQ